MTLAAGRSAQLSMTRRIHQHSRDALAQGFSCSFMSAVDVDTDCLSFIPEHRPSRRALFRCRFSTPSWNKQLSVYATGAEFLLELNAHRIGRARLRVVMHRGLLAIPPAPYERLEKAFVERKIEHKRI
jgi:hypothetical protein